MKFDDNDYVIENYPHVNDYRPVMDKIQKMWEDTNHRQTIISLVESYIPFYHQKLKDVSNEVDNCTLTGNKIFGLKKLNNNNHLAYKGYNTNQKLCLIAIVALQKFVETQIYVGNKNIADIFNRKSRN